MTDSPEKEFVNNPVDLAPSERTENNNFAQTAEEFMPPGAKGKESHIDRTLTWHEHVYRKLTQKPTPHYIENILGFPSKSCASDSDKLKVNPASSPAASEVVPKITITMQDLNEPLNLSVRPGAKTRVKSSKGESMRLFVNVHLISRIHF